MGLSDNLRQLARDSLTKAASWFSPGTPQTALNPVGTPPYRYDFPRQQNVWGKPRTELPNLQSFEDIRKLALLYPVNAACISTRIREIQGLNWTIKPKDKELQTYFKSKVGLALDFFGHPERDDLTFSDWLAALLRDRLETDSLTLYRRPNRAGGLYSVEAIDGSTIKPIIDTYGRVQGYQQYKFGLPSGNFKRPDSVVDKDVPFIARSEMIYKPYNRSTYSPYGLSPVEQAYELIKTLILKQSFDQAYFTEGDLPLTAITFPPGAFTSEQVESFADKFRAMLEASLEARNKVQFLPYDADFHELKRFEYNTDLEKYALQMTCAVHNMPPSELGITDDVNRASSDGQENLNYRKGINPLTKSLKEIFDFILQDENYLDLPQLEWAWDFGETEDKLAIANTDKVYLDAGVFTPEEIKAARISYLG